MIKLIAIDLDGTLLTNAKTISERNRTALKKAREAGIQIVLCTGRPLAAITPYLEMLDLKTEEAYSITFNGGLVQKNLSGTILEKASLTLADLHVLYTALKDAALPMDVLSEETVYQLPTAPLHPSIYQELNPMLQFQARALAQLDEQTLYNKVVVAHEANYLAAQLLQLSPSLQTRFEMVRTRRNLFEFMPKGVTKARGLALLAKDLQLTAAQMMAIGDEENDLSMLKYAKIGVAMANAVPSVKQAATLVTKSNEEDGVAQVIEDLVLRPLKGGN